MRMQMSRLRREKVVEVVEKVDEIVVQSLEEQNENRTHPDEFRDRGQYAETLEAHGFVGLLLSVEEKFAVEKISGDEIFYSQLLETDSDQTDRKKQK